MKNSKIINRVKDALYPILTFLALLVIWQVSVSKMNVPSYILPSPLDIVEEFKKDWPVLLMHSKVTLTETILGLSIYVVIAL